MRSRPEGVVLRLSLDNSNKWDATEKMLVYALRAQMALLEYLRAFGNEVPEGGVLSGSDFQLLREVDGVLRPLCNCVHILETDEFKGSSVLPWCSVLMEELEPQEGVELRRMGDHQVLDLVPAGQLSAPAKDFRRALRAELVIVLRHLDDSREELLMASALDPRWRGMAWADEGEREAVSRRLVREAVAQVRAGPQREQAAEEGSEIPGRSRLRRAGMSRLLERAGRRAGGAAVGAAAEDLAGEVTKAVKEWMDSPQTPHDESPLDWWAQALGKEVVSASVRLLAPLARRYLAIPGSNGRIERLWSDGKRVLTALRTSLDPDRVSMLLRLKANMELVSMWPPQALALP